MSAPGRSPAVPPRHPRRASTSRLLFEDPDPLSRNVTGDRKKATNNYSPPEGSPGVPSSGIGSEGLGVILR